jgi:hypothetical protein
MILVCRTPILLILNFVIVLLVNRPDVCGRQSGRGTEEKDRASPPVL